VIGTRVGGTPEALADGAAGVLIEPGQAGPLASALERLFHEPRLRGELGAVARKRVIERFSIEGMIAATEAAFLAAGGAAVRPTVAVAS
jgi:glycosyltransferase involved in cell wall biosynthesis